MANERIESIIKDLLKMWVNFDEMNKKKNYVKIANLIANLSNKRDIIAKEKERKKQNEKVQLLIGLELKHWSK